CDIGRDYRGFGQFADPEFGRYLARRSGAREHLAARIGDGIASDRRQCRIAEQPPEQRVGVQQQTHPYALSESGACSQGSSSSGGSGSKNSGPISNWPRIAPKTRFPLGATAVSLATGLLPRAMMISSPASARATSLERLVLAAWIDTISDMKQLS